MVFELLQTLCKAFMKCLYLMMCTVSKMFCV